MKRVLLIGSTLLAACGPGAQRSEAPAESATLTTVDWKGAPGLYAVFQTEKGEVVARLFEDKAPKTVANFAGLASGTKEFTDPRDNRRKKGRYYDGTVFFRVIPGFMIQGGDPLNKGYGGPGYQFEDEFHPSLRFDRPGLLAMANAGPGTNGSQFFITDRPRSGVGLPSHLDNHHTIFGEVVSGLEVVGAIADVAANGDQAVNPVRITKLEIVKVEKKGQG